MQREKGSKEIKKESHLPFSLCTPSTLPTFFPFVHDDICVWNDRALSFVAGIYEGVSFRGWRIG
jgi:hypothetical protein